MGEKEKVQKSLTRKYNYSILPPECLVSGLNILAVSKKPFQSLVSFTCVGVKNIRTRKGLFSMQPQAREYTTFDTSIFQHGYEAFESEL